MASFKDANQKAWTIELDGPTIGKIRKVCDLDLAKLDGSAYQRLMDDPVLLVDTLWVLCSDQARQDGITDFQFGRALVGDAIERATAAMLESIADFFPHRKSQLLLAIAAANREIFETGLAKALGKITDPQLQAGMAAALEEQMDAEIRTLLTRFASATS